MRATEFIPFTFHYGPILTLRLLYDTYKKIEIYIPLWSDSNPVSSWSAFIACIIYIPLWSDSNINITRIWFRSIRIYIPLWSDSNLRLWSVGLFWDVFTFHYGPILTGNCNWLNRRIKGIYIPLWSDSNKWMKFAGYNKEKIYIPLWSDSNLEGFFLTTAML